MTNAGRRYVDAETDEQRFRRQIGHPASVVEFGDPRAFALAMRRAALSGGEILSGGCACGWWWCGRVRVRYWTDLELAVSALQTRAKIDPWSEGVVQVAEWYRKAELAAVNFRDIDALRRAVARVAATGLAAEHRKRILAELDPDWSIGAIATKAWRLRPGEQEQAERIAALNTARDLGWTKNTPAVVTAILLLTGVRRLRLNKKRQQETFAGLAKGIEAADQRRKRNQRGSVTKP